MHVHILWNWENYPYRHLPPNLVRLDHSPLVLTTPSELRSHDFFLLFFFSSFFFYPFCFLWFSFFEKWTDCPIVRIKALESDLRMSILHMILTRSDGQQRYLHRPPDLIGMVHTLKSREISMYRINFWVLSFPPISHSKLYLQIELILKKTKLQLYCTFFFSSSSDFIHPLYVVL